MRWKFASAAAVGRVRAGAVNFMSSLGCIGLGRSACLFHANLRWWEDIVRRRGRVIGLIDPGSESRFALVTDPAEREADLIGGDFVLC